MLLAHRIRLEPSLDQRDYFTRNLQRLATGALAARTALPEASQAVTPGTAAGTVPSAGGKVTPVRHEHGQQDGSGQEEYDAHVCARF